MKILMTADTLGGVWTYAVELCAALAGADIQIALATMGRALSPGQRAQLQGLDHVTLFESQYRLCWMENPWEDIAQAGDWLLQLEADWQPDLVHLNDLGHGGLPWRSPVLLVAHSCVATWWDAVKGAAAPPDWARFRSLVSAAVARADRLVAPTRAMLDAFCAEYGQPAACQVIHNGRSFPALLAPDSTQREPIFFSAGRIWDEAKNIGLLARIAEELPWPVRLAGEGEVAGTSDRLQALGPLDPQALAGELGRASVYVLPAFYEPFGLSALEAARAGCALVLGDIPSLREVWQEAATYVAPDKPQELVQALTNLAGDVELRLEMARRAHARSLEYSAEGMAAEYRQLYNRLTGRSQDSRYRHQTTAFA